VLLFRIPSLFWCAIVERCQSTVFPRCPHTFERTAAQSMELQRLGIENIPGQESARVVHSNSVHTAK
jgi:hypothetical protein